MIIAINTLLDMVIITTFESNSLGIWNFWKKINITLMKDFDIYLKNGDRYFSDNLNHLFVLLLFLILTSKYVNYLERFRFKLEIGKR